MTALLDTHVLIWWLNDSNRLSPAQQEVVASASAESPLLVSDISLWEVATLHSLGRIQLTIPLHLPNSTIASSLPRKWNCGYRGDYQPGHFDHRAFVMSSILTAIESA